MILVQEKYPPPHARYLVQRDRALFTATPCYGMHNPWWVVLTMDGEVAPVAIEKTDKWIPLGEVWEKLT